MLRAVIIDDEKTSRDTLKILLSQNCRQVEVVDEADDIQSGIEVIQHDHPDVVFLDIQMPDGSGFKLLEGLKAIDFEVIFVTAYDQYAIQAIKYSALDYLLKPIIIDELINAVEKAEKKKASSQFSKNIQVLLENLRTPSAKPHKIIIHAFFSRMVNLF
jgi:two-component system LytT family response regulator